MMTDAQKLMAGVVRLHERNPWGQHDGWWECCCGEVYSHEHVAAEIDKALGGLTPTQGLRVKWSYPGEVVDVSGWVSGGGERR